MLDIPGGHGKVPIGPCHLAADEDGGWQVRDPNGRWHSHGD
jgi:lysine 2,3-aminomutase